MKEETNLIIIGAFLGFSIGVLSMLYVNIDQRQKMYERDIQLDSNTKFLIQENIGTCEDMIEWMNEDVFNECDSTMYYIYIPKLESMAEYNRDLLYETSKEGLNLQTEYDH